MVDTNTITFISVFVIVLVNLAIIFTRPTEDDSLSLTLSIWISFAGGIILLLISGWYLIYVTIYNHKLTSSQETIVIYLLIFEAIAYLVGGLFGITSVLQAGGCGCMALTGQATYTFWIGLYSVVTSVVLLIMCGIAIRKRNKKKKKDELRSQRYPSTTEKY
jgi:uncharacterized protein YacL